MISLFKPYNFTSPNRDGSFCIEEFIYQADKIVNAWLMKITNTEESRGHFYKKWFTK